jgi:putative transposase
MPRKNLIRVKRLPYHVTTRTHNQEYFNLPLDTIWEFLELSLKEAYELYPIDLIALVLMNNHYHMILITPNENLDKFMYEFNKRLALRIKGKSEKQNQVFGARYKWSVIRTFNYFSNCYRYVYQNPLRAKIVNKAEDYPYSTLFYIVRGLKFIIPLHDKFGFKDRFNLVWLNEKIKDEDALQIKKDLKRFLEPLKKY